MSAIIVAIISTIVFGYTVHRLIRTLLTTPRDGPHYAALERVAEGYVVLMIIAAVGAGCALEQILP
jgi:hypothetical protein